ncbi:MAG TPA: hypothetical protein VK168_18270 [Saprospiraceae bacterium]|nr:hypothetical protein [Saprospiraceae bacterium]
MILKIILSTLSGGILATLLVWLAGIWMTPPVEMVPLWAFLVSNILQAFLLSMLFQRWLDAWGFLRGAWHGGWIAGLFAGAFYLRGVSTNWVHLFLFSTLVWTLTGGVMGYLLQKMRGQPVFRW